MSAGWTGALALCAAICAAAPSASAQATFPGTPVGADASSQTIVLQNGPFAPPVTLGQPAVSGAAAAAFRLVADTCTGRTLYSSEACNATVIFRPGRIGAHTATLTVPVEGEPEAPFSSELSGEGIEGLRLAPSPIDFGAVFLPSRSQQEVLVENVSGGDLSLFPRIEPATLAFRLYRPPVPDVCPSHRVPLAAGATCRLGVTFIPRPGLATEARLVFGGTGAEMGSVALRGTVVPRPPAAPIRFPTPDATGVLRKGLRAALARLRGRSRAALLKRGLIIRGLVPPARGVLGLSVHARRTSSAGPLVAVRRRLPVQPGQKATIRAHLTRAGRRRLRSGRPLVLDVKLTLVARSDDRLSEASGVLRLGRVPKRR